MKYGSTSKFQSRAEEHEEGTEQVPTPVKLKT